MMSRKYIIATMVILSMAVAGAVWAKQWFASPVRLEEDTATFLQKMMDANKPGSRYFEQQGEMLLTDATLDKEKVLEQRNFTWWYGGEVNAYSLDSVMVVQDTISSIQVDHRHQQILIVPLSSAAARQWSLTEILKTLQEMNARMQLDLEGDLKVLTVDSLSIPEFQGYRIFVDAQTYEVRKMLIGMNQLQPLNDQEAADETEDLFTYLLEINYKPRRMISREEMPRISNFVQADPSVKGKLIPAGAYQRYRILAQPEDVQQEINETE